MGNEKPKKKTHPTELPEGLKDLDLPPTAGGLILDLLTIEKKTEEPDELTGSGLIRDLLKVDKDYEEKRRGFRAILLGTAVLIDMAGKIVFKGTCANISESGLALQARTSELKPDLEVFCDIVSKGDLKSFRIKGTVARIVPIKDDNGTPGFLVGIRFKDVGQLLQKRLTDYIAKCEKETAQKKE